MASQVCHALFSEPPYLFQFPFEHPDHSNLAAGLVDQKKLPSQLFCTQDRGEEQCSCQRMTG